MPANPPFSNRKKREKHCLRVHKRAFAKLECTMGRVAMQQEWMQRPDIRNPKRELHKLHLLLDVQRNQFELLQVARARLEWHCALPTVLCTLRVLEQRHPYALPVAIQDMILYFVAPRPVGKIKWWRFYSLMRLRRHVAWNQSILGWPIWMDFWR
jgi:hypothetical protein